ncbi:MAG: DUF4173 domain-containing protein [Lachnospiraceae bacterium]|nr:DUF4173 domain-containing protein [Lachnospiraceae bacterium]
MEDYENSQMTDAQIRPVNPEETNMTQAAALNLDNHDFAQAASPNPGDYSFAPAAPINLSKAAEPEGTVSLIENFGIFGIASILYGIFFTFCLYKNYVGITLPFFAAATLFYYGYTMQKLGKVIRKDSVFYGACILILSFGTIFTDNGLFIFFNYVGMLLLLVTCLILNFYENTNFRFGSYIAAILSVLLGSIGYLAYPFRSLNLFLSRRTKKDSKGKYIWFGILIAVPLLIVIMALLMSADAVFRNLFNEIFENIVIPENVIGICFMLCLGTLGSYMIIANLSSGQSNAQSESKRIHEPIVAITFTSVLTVIYLLFSFIQIFYLFLGNLKLPEGYTYAQYAREGFFQLLFVCIINLFIVLICIDYFKEHTVLKAVLSVFCACTFIMIASSAMRMILYIQAYQLSSDRVLVLWALFVITILMALVCINIFKADFPLFRYGVVVVSVCYILLSLSRPDTYIAKYNIEASHADNSSGDSTDYYYLLYDLSADATPVLESYGLLESIRGIHDEDRSPEVHFTSSGSDAFDAYTYYYYYDDLLEKGKRLNLRTFNFSRYHAYQIAKSHSDVVKVASEE